METIKEIIARILSIEEAEIKDQTARDKTESWDSFNHLLLVSEIEKEFNIKFTIKEVEETKTFKELESLVNSKKR